ncbi:hypothetical protein GCM10010310_07830 [Streptomyces violaceolatus]|uniref:Transposase n=1 Tax=Streptomyces violaceolatus TaxID=67378 RepID=A0ABN3SAZ2_9ACTN|nr:hypothetical protein GCM10010391_02390 [Streptomyces anthocyanicus]
MRLTDPHALQRCTAGLRRGSDAVVRTLLGELALERACLQGERGGAPPGREAPEAAGVRRTTVPGAGHNVVLDRPTRPRRRSPGGTDSVRAGRQGQEPIVLVDVRRHRPPGTGQ